MVSTLSSVRQPAVRGCLSSESIDTTGSPRNVGTTHLLEGSYTGKSPEVTIGDPWEFVLDGFQQPTGDLETRVGAVKGLGFETHGGIIAIIIKRLERIPGFLNRSSGGVDQLKEQGRGNEPAAGLGLLVIST